MIVNYKKTEMYNEMHEELFCENFDEKCKNLSQCMRILGWQWADAINGYPSPTEVASTIIHMHKSIFEHFSNASYECLRMNGGQFTIKSGGFEMNLYYNLERLELNGIDLKFDIWEHKAC